MLLFELFGSRNDAGCIMREQGREGSMREPHASWILPGSLLYCTAISTEKQSLLYVGHGKAMGKHKVGRGVGKPE